MKLSRFSCLIAALLLFLPLAVSAETSEPLVRITADSIVHESIRSTVQADGNVRVKWQEYTLHADSVEYAQDGGVVKASGGVILLRADDVLNSDTLSINPRTKKGLATNARLLIGLDRKKGSSPGGKTGGSDQKMRMKGELIQKVDDNRYLIEDGSFTTCDADPPSWKFRASDLDITLDGFATGKNVVFSLGPVPVFYTPYIIFPVTKERQSGFLFPRIGTSTVKGAFLDIPYYWAISPSAEATFDLDIQSRRGVGTGVNAKWLRQGGSYGTLQVYGIYDSQVSNYRSEVSTQIKEFLTPTVDFNADIAIVSDRSLFQDFYVESGEFNRQLTDSSVSVTKRWNSLYLAGETRFFNDLAGPNNNSVLQRLPDITFNGTEDRISNFPVYASFDSRYTNFYRSEGISGGRVILQPKLTYRAPLPDGLALNGWGAYQQRLYDASGGDGEGESAVGLAMAGAGASATVSREFAVSFANFRRVKHTIVPALEFSYVQERDQDHLPFFDYDDRVIGGEQVSWILSNSLTGRYDNAGIPGYRELLHFRLSQSYQLSGDRRDLLNPVDKHRPFTDIRMEAGIQPLRFFSIVSDTRFSPYNGEVSTAAVSADLKDGTGNVAAIAYREIAGAVRYLEGSVAINIVKPFVVQYTGRYSVDSKDFLENYYAVEYHHQCWSLGASYRERPDNKEYLLNFTLAGIGSIGKIKPY